MPNWACGTVLVTGIKQNVLSFANRFIYDGDGENTDELTKRRYFARSFADTTRQEMMRNLDDIFGNKSSDTSCVFSLPIGFAWSACSCLIQGYPQDFPSKCITLMEACRTDHVKVEIWTEESGMRFEEHVVCDKHGYLLSNEAKELQDYECPHCGNTMGIASFNDLDDYVCYECGKQGLMLISEMKG